MYLISIYFDEKTEKHIRSFMKQVAKKTGNTYMLDGNVPPHITIAAFEMQNIYSLMPMLEDRIKTLNKGKITWASVSAFLPHVIYIAPVLNKYLYDISEKMNEALQDQEGIRLRPNYQPFNWMPHTTIAKKLSKEEMQSAFEVLQNSFGMFEGQAVKIGLAKTNPYTDIRVWELR